MLWFKRKTKWYAPNKKPELNKKIIFMTPENDIYTGIFEGNKVTLYEFVGMPFFSWKHDVKLWTYEIIN
jgi:hypothetical protein